MTEPTPAAQPDTDDIRRNLRRAVTTLAARGATPQSIAVAILGMLAGLVDAIERIDDDRQPEQFLTEGVRGIVDALPEIWA